MGKSERLLRGVQRREIVIRAESVDEDKRTAELAISSEDPYERWLGVEILGHEDGEIRLDRLKNAAPLLLNHDMRTQIGVIEGDTVRIDKDKKLRATVRFSRGALGEEIMQDVADGIRQKVSVGYRVFAYEYEKDESGKETDRYRVTDWEPMEASIVSVPADDTVGVGRSHNDNSPPPAPHDAVQGWREIVTAVALAARAMNDNGSDDGAANNGKESPMADTTKGGAGAAPSETKNEVQATQVDVTGAVEQERARIAEINAIAQRFDVLDGKTVEQATREAWSVDKVREHVLDLMEQKGITATPADYVDGMSEDDVRRFSLLNCLRAQMPGVQVDASLERQVSQQIARQLGQDPKGFYIPANVHKRRMPDHKRTLTAGTATGAAELVGTDHMGGEFIDVLRNMMVLRSLGIRILSGLRGDVSIPKKTSASSASWKAAEGANAANSEFATTSVTMVPKTCAAYTDLSRDLILQGVPSAEDLVRDDLGEAAALAIDLAGIAGSGASGQPTGILNTSGIGDVPGGTNGLAPTWANMVKIWQEVAIDNAAMGALNWLTNSAVAGKCMTVERFSSTGKTILEDNPMGFRLLGFPVVISNQVPSDLDKGTSTGVCSAAIFGNFRDLLLGEWGGYDVLLDPYTQGLAGTVRVIVHQSVDVAIRRAQSFAACQDLLTT